MKYWIQKNLHGVLVIMISIFVVAMMAPEVDAQSRGRSGSDKGKKERVERKSDNDDAKARSSRKRSGKKESAASKRRSSPNDRSDKKAVRKPQESGSRTSGARAQQKRSNTSDKGDRRRIERRDSDKGRSARSSGPDEKKVDRKSSRKSFKSVNRGTSGDDSAGKGRGSRGSGSQGVDSGSRGNSGKNSGRGVRGGSGSGVDNNDGGSNSGRGVRSGSREGSRGTVGNDNRGNQSGRGVRGGSRSGSRGSSVGNSGRNNGKSGGRITVRDGKRGRYTGPIFDKPRKAKKYKYHGKHKWQHNYFRPDRVHVSVYPRNWHRHVHVSSHVHIGITWPWQRRYHKHWKPRYRYRQVIYVDAGWGRHRRQSRIDVRTYYKQRVRHATADYAEIEIDIDAIELFENGQFIGYVDRIPRRLREINATVWADGRVEFDRNVFLVGDTYRGFEMISTRYYDDYLLNAYDRSHGVRVGRVDLRKERVREIRRSRLFRPYNFDGNVPVSLLPEDDRLFDYSYELFSGYYDDDYDRYDDSYGRGYYGSEGVRGDYLNAMEQYEDGLARIDEVSYATEAGASIAFTRESALERIE